MKGGATFMKWFKVKEAEKILGVSHTSIHNRLKKFQKHLQDHVKRENGAILVDQYCVNFLKDTFKTIEIKDKVELNVSESLLETLQTQLNEKDGLIKELMTTQKEIFQSHDEAQKRHDTIIMTLTQQVQNQSKQLEDLRNKPEVVRPKVNKVSSIRRKAESVETGGGEVSTSHPKENWGLFMQAWVKMFQPWKMRRDFRGKKAA
jgi:hypothetical protein